VTAADFQKKYFNLLWVKNMRTIIRFIFIIAWIKIPLLYEFFLKNRFYNTNTEYLYRYTVNEYEYRMSDIAQNVKRIRSK
jgi:hypothetical protein